ncbi:acyl carrier protein [Streptomyces sp. PA5.6]|uniref:acyl carrier protein n=1 Tax=Streptomyces sp. PA5.6 TaxID=3035651 RepID=UPI00390480E8
MTQLDESSAQRPQQPELPAELVALLADRLDVTAESDQLSPSTTFADLGLDSLWLMELVIAAEEEFGIVLPEDALDLRPTSTLGEAAAAFEHVS